MDRAQLRATQKPIKERYRQQPDAALITLEAEGQLDEQEIACSVSAGQALRAEGDLDFRGTLGVADKAPTGFRAIRLIFALRSDATDEQMATLLRLTERYCVVYQTLAGGVPRQHPCRQND